MKTRLAFLIALSFAAPSARLPAQQTMSARNDLAGTWLISKATSDFGAMAAPTIDSSTTIRVGNAYQIDVTSDFGGQGTQHQVLNWPIGEGETTTNLASGASIHTATKLQHDTVTFLNTISFNGRTVASQTGWVYRSPDGKTLTRDITTEPPAGSSAEPLHFRLVYDRR